MEFLQIDENVKKNFTGILATHLYFVIGEQYYCFLFLHISKIFSNSNCLIMCLFGMFNVHLKRGECMGVWKMARTTGCER